MPAALTVSAEAMLEDLPPYEHRSHDIRAAIAAIAGERDRFEVGLGTLRQNQWPQFADEYLDRFERLFKLSVAPADKTVAQRRTSVLANFMKLKTAGTGLDWQAMITELLGSGWTYAEHDPDDIDSPAPYTIAISIPFTAPINFPTGLGLTSGAGTLAANTYHYAVAAINLLGETEIGGVEDITVGASSSVVLDWNDVDVATGYNVYRGLSAGSLKRLDTGAVETSTYTDTGAAALTAINPANTNTTGSFQSREARRLIREITPSHIALIFNYEEGFIVGVNELGDFL